MKKEYVYPTMNSSRIRTSIICGSGDGEVSIQNGNLEGNSNGQTPSRNDVFGNGGASGDARRRGSLGF